jgi:hypothetical protein
MIGLTARSGGHRREELTWAASVVPCGSDPMVQGVQTTVMKPMDILPAGEKLGGHVVDDVHGDDGAAKSCGEESGARGKGMRARVYQRVRGGPFLHQ